ncbi:hypothetical protein [Pinibacter aurantiacus]|uniref:Uncharacterized protein n=1 Tax=Pinibacter aurantiacus TaxID=2851599 RepID=A0A9E2SEF4_9BACT|nr:hypothetical protein [Pinibacter aurantiacus]MBV4360219.1 hypothetical protein [Pinibacter aurantiacus]
MYKLIISITFILIAGISFGQHISKADVKALQLKQDTLKKYAEDMINAQEPSDRFVADSLFVRGLVRALKTHNSFYYPFDSLQTVSKLCPPDSTFRIFTWQMKKDEYFYLQKGAIQYRTANGELKLVPLFDQSMFTSKPEDSVRSNRNWIGAVYYRIIEKTYNNKKYYTLIGFDSYTVSSNRKWIDVLTFDEKTGDPIFGGGYFSFKNDTTKKAPQNRFYIEYKKEAGTTFNYNPELDMIVYDHLTSETEEPERKETYVPDGDFEGFKWEKGQWVHVDKVFNFKLKEGEEPVEQTIRDANGNINEQRLLEQSQKNEKKKKQ